MIFVGFNGMLIILLLAFIRGFAGVKFDVTQFPFLDLEEYGRELGTEYREREEYRRELGTKYRF